jgi:hypothetical protein
MSKYSRYKSIAYITISYLKLINHELEYTKQGYPYCRLVKCSCCKRIILNDLAIVYHPTKTSRRSRHKCIPCFMRYYGKVYTRRLLQYHIKIRRLEVSKARLRKALIRYGLLTKRSKEPTYQSSY